MDYLELLDRIEGSSMADDVEYVDLHKPTAYPYFDLVTNQVSIAVALSARVGSNSRDKHHTTVISYRVDPTTGEDSFGIWCGDSFLEGRAPIDRITQYVSLFKESFPAQSTDYVTSELKATASIYSKSDGCNFWGKWKKSGSLCKHTESFLSSISKTDVDSLKAKYLEITGQDASTEASPVSLSESFSIKGLAFRVPVLVEGDRGAGKTMEARMFAESYATVELGGNESIESADLLGFLVPYSQGAMVWKDGPLSSAFRSASKGIKTVFIIDELLRIPQRELSILLTALSPYKGKYSIRTGRIISVEDGIGSEETLSCDVANLAVIATTNVGSEYAVDDIDPALAERFFVLRSDTTSAKIKQVASDMCKEKGFSAKLATKLVDFFNKMSKAKLSGLVHQAPTTRTIARAIELASTEQDVADVLIASALLWVARSSEGIPVKEQLESVRTLVSKVMVDK